MLCGKSFAYNFIIYKRKVAFKISIFSTRWKSNKIPNVLFFGTDNFSLPSLKILHTNNFDVSVVTSFKSPANCVRNYAEQHRLSLHRWPISAEKCTSFDMGVVVSFGHLIPLNIINAFKCGIINVHASLLPRWRGAAPIIYAIMAGDTTTGISIMKIAPHQFDIGPILAQREIPIKSDVYMPQLYVALSKLGAELLLDTLNNFEERLLKARPQIDAYATYAPKITSKITEISWTKQTATELFNRYRALYGYKNLTTTFQGKTVVLLELKLPEDQGPAFSIPTIPGSIYFHRARKSLIIGCAQDTQLEVLRLRVEGKKPMSAHDFNNGFLKQANSLKFIQNELVNC